MNDGTIRCPRCRTTFWAVRPLCPECGHILDGEAEPTAEPSDPAIRPAAAPAPTGETASSWPLMALALIGMLVLAATTIAISSRAMS